jgi:hypothetical protein
MSMWMMRRPLFAAMLLTSLAAAACAGESGEPLLSGTLSGQFRGQSFTPTSGVATVYQGSNMIALGDGPINCSSTQQNDPPMGTTATFSVPALDVATYSSIFVDMIRYSARNFDGVGSTDGTVTLTAVSATSVAGTIAYSYTDSTDQQTYGISGSFEVKRCPM